MSIHEQAGAPGSVHEPVTHVVESHAKRGLLRWPLLAAVVAALGLLGWRLAHSHASESVTPTADPHDNDAPVQDGDLIRFSDAFAARAHITSERAGLVQLEPFVTVSGTLTYDPHHYAAVGARIHGRVRRVFKYVGDTVQRGTVLAEIESAELGRAQANVLAARAKEKAAEADMKRERYLADQKISAEREAELAQASHAAAHAERVAAERALEALGGDAQANPGYLVLRSPLAGQVLEGTASLGKTVDPTETLFEVAELSSLWVELPVFERELAGVRMGEKVEISAIGMPDQVIEGKVDHIGSVIDLDTRSARVRVVIANEQGALRPGQSVVARIHTSKPTSQNLSVPRAALTRIDGKPTVFVLHDKNTVEPRGVVTGPEDSEHVAIRSGIEQGERVVVGGMFALKSELFR